MKYQFSSGYSICQLFINKDGISVTVFFISLQISLRIFLTHLSETMALFTHRTLTIKLRRDSIREVAFP